MGNFLPFIVLFQVSVANYFELPVHNKSDRKGNNKVSKRKLKKYLFGEKTKQKLANFATRCITDSPLASSVAHQNAGFALVH